MEKMKQTRTRYHNQGLYLVISCINLLMLTLLLSFSMTLSDCPLYLTACERCSSSSLLFLLYNFKRSWGGKGRGTGPSVPLDAGEGRILNYTRKACK